MEKNNQEVKTVETVEIAERPDTCRGSFRLGSACGVCERCKAAGFDLEKKAEAQAAEVERTKHLPADRVKKDGYENQKSEERKADEKAELKEEIKDELKPEIKEEIKDEIKPELKEEIKEEMKEEAGETDPKPNK